MNLTQALNSAVAGLRVSEAGLALVSANVSNAQTPGYVRKSLTPVTTSAGGDLLGVRVASVDRQLEKYLQNQLRTESSGGAYADLRSQFYQRLQQVYGDPSAATSLANLYDGFTSSLQSLMANPADYSARLAVLSSARAVTQQLNTMSGGIQALRSDAEQGLADCVRSANDALQGLAQVNTQLATAQVHDGARGALLDQRDRYLDQLSQLMDVRININNLDQADVFTSSGIQLVGAKASQLTFDPQGTVTPDTLWSADPQASQLGTISIVNPAGGSMDLVQDKAFRSGQIAAYLEMRDQVLVQAQTQLDEFAAAMSRALSDKTTAGTPVTSGAQAGFDIDVSGLLAGNSIHIAYTDVTTNTRHKATIVRVDDPNALPLADTVTTDPNDTVIGVDWSGGLAGVVGQLNAAFGGKLAFSAPNASTLRVLDDGVANTSDVDAAAATSTVTTLTGGSAELPFFMDGGLPFSGAITSAGPQSRGLAARLSVNAALLGDPSKLVAYQATAAAGDNTRPAFIYDQLTSASLTFSPAAGIGTAAAPFTGVLPGFLRQALSQQGDAASAAKSLSEGQGQVVNALRQRFNDGAAVDINQEMSKLLTLQTAYAANARVFTTVNTMLDTLLKM